jgi:hypothetical protein
MTFDLHNFCTRAIKKRVIVDLNQPTREKSTQLLKLSKKLELIESILR